MMVLSRSDTVRDDANEAVATRVVEAMIITRLISLVAALSGGCRGSQCQFGPALDLTLFRTSLA